MLPHPPLSLLCVADTEGSALSSLYAYLESIPHVRVTVAAQWPAALDAYDVVISHGGEANQGRHPDLEGFVDRGGGWLVLIDAAEQPPALLGVTCSPPGVEAELRVLFDKADHPLAARVRHLGSLADVEARTGEVDDVLGILMHSYFDLNRA